MTKRIEKKRSIRITTHNKLINPECYNHPIWKRRKARSKMGRRFRFVAVGAPNRNKRVYASTLAEAM